MSNILDPDQAQHVVESDLGPDSLQRLALVTKVNCKPGVAGSIPSFTSLSGETLSRGPVSIWPQLLVGY